MKYIGFFLSMLIIIACSNEPSAAEIEYEERYEQFQLVCVDNYARNIANAPTLADEYAFEEYCDAMLDWLTGGF